MEGREAYKCPMEGICYLYRSKLAVEDICKDYYRLCAEYELLLTDMKYHHQRKDEAEKLYEKN
jgi:hypothetical protein